MSTDTRTDEYFINTLPDELLVKIFNNFSITDQFYLRLVCKKWQKLLEYVLENRTQLVITNYMIKPLRNDLKTKLTVKDYIYFESELEYKMIEQVLLKCQNLKTLLLNLYEVTIDPQVILLFNKHYSDKLENLILIIDDNDDFINELIISIVLRCGNNLKFVELEGDLSATCVKFLIKSAPNLESFSIFPYSHLVHKHSQIIAKKCFSLFQEKLQQLNLMQVIYDYEDIKALCNSKCKNLKRLHLWEAINSQMLKEICESFTFLNDIGFICENVNKEELKLIPNNLHNLEKVCLYLPKYNCDDVLLEIMKVGDKLTELHVKGVANSITDKSIKHISDYCPLIQKLTVDAATNLNDKSFNSISKLSQLKELHIPCANITDNELIKIVNSCEKINKLGIYSCNKITDKFLHHCIELAKSRPTSVLMIFYPKITKIDLPKNLEIV